MKMQRTELENNFVLVELQDGVVCHEYNVDYDLFERAGNVPLFQNQKRTKFDYKGIYYYLTDSNFIL